MDDDAPQHFGLDPRKLSLAEFWRAPQRGSFLAGLFFKLVRLEVPVPRAVPLTEALIEIDPADRPLAAQRLRPIVAELEQLGYELSFWYREDIVHLHGEDAAVVLLAPDGRTYASAFFSSARIADKLIEDVRAVFVSRLDRRIVVTSNVEGEMDSPPEFDGEVVRGTLADAHARHRERIGDASGDAYRGSSAAFVFDRDELRRFVITVSRRVVEHGVARGVFKPMKREQVEALRRGEPTALSRRGPSVGATVLVWVLLVVLVTIIALL